MVGRTGALVGSSHKRNDRAAGSTARLRSPGVRDRGAPAGDTGPMAFGQPSGPPATAKQVRQLTELVLAAGHTDLRDARGPLGLSQRQAGGRFTRDEADELIARLEAEAEADPDADASAPTPHPAPTDRFNRREAQRREALARMPAEALAAELQRRGWVVLEP